MSRSALSLPPFNRHRKVHMLIWQEYTDPPKAQPPTPRRPLSLSDTGPILWHWIIVGAWAAVFCYATLKASGWL